MSLDCNEAWGTNCLRCLGQKTELSKLSFKEQMGSAFKRVGNEQRILLSFSAVRKWWLAGIGNEESRKCIPGLGPWPNFINYSSTLAGS